MTGIKIYTRQGDGGGTSLIHQKKISKSDPRIRCLGVMDELNAHLGLIKVETGDTDRIEAIQKRVMSISAWIAGSDYGVEAGDVKELEGLIDGMQNAMPQNNAFIIPGGSIISAKIDIARTVCRRAETLAAEVSESYPVHDSIMKYINRLSDFLFIYARYCEFVSRIVAAVREELKETPLLKKQYAFDLSAAKRIIEAVEQKANEEGIPAVIAVVNAQGNPVAVHVMDGAYLISYDVALNKAYTSAALKMATVDLYPHVQPGGMFYGLELSGGGRITAIGGGVPLMDGEELAGGLGVSGGSDEQDKLLAEYGLKVFNDERRRI